MELLFARKSVDHAVPKMQVRAFSFQVRLQSLRSDFIHIGPCIFRHESIAQAHTKKLHTLPIVQFPFKHFLILSSHPAHHTNLRPPLNYDTYAPPSFLCGPLLRAPWPADFAMYPETTARVCLARLAAGPVCRMRPISSKRCHQRCFRDP